MRSLALISLIALRGANAQCGSEEEVIIDFNTATNPTLRMSWLNGNGVSQNGVDNPAQFCNQNTGECEFLPNTITPGLNVNPPYNQAAPFPNGELRLESIGRWEGQVFDMLITIPQTFTFYSELIAMQYYAPVTLTGTQASLTEGGFACLGLALQTALCEGTGSPDFLTARCPSGQATYLHGTEFDLTLVKTGTYEPMAPFRELYMTFYDVDGDASIPSGRIYEVNAVNGAVGVVIAPTSTLITGQWFPSETVYVEASEAINIQTDLNQDINDVASVSLPAIGAFRIQDASEFKIVVGGRSSVPEPSDRGYCFGLGQPDLAIICPPPPSPSPYPPPVSPVPSPPPPVPPPPPPPTPHPPPQPLQPAERWGRYIIELNYTYPGTKSRIESPSIKTRVGVETSDEKVPTVYTDVDNDGMPDLLTKTSIYPSTGTQTNVPGFFNDPFHIGVEPDTFTSMVVADMNNDGKVDVVAGYRNNPTTPLRESGVKIFYNPGSDDFSQVVGEKVGDRDQDTQSVDVVDINGDGRLDVIAGNRGQTNKLYLSYTTFGGSAKFYDAIDIGSETDDTTDIVVKQMRTISTEPISLGAGVIVNGDENLLDVIVSNEGQTNKIYTTTVAQPRYATFDTPLSVGIDTDASSKVITTNNGADIIVANKNQPNKYYKNPGSGDFSSVTGVNIGAETDDTRDIITTTLGGNSVIMTANAVQTNKYYRFTEGDPSGLPTTPYLTIGTEADDSRSIIATDFGTPGGLASGGGDGNNDVIVTNSDGVKTFVNPGNNDFSSVEPLVVGSGALNSAMSVGFGDMDSNGYLDIISGNMLYLNPGGADAGDFTDVEPKPFAFLENDVKDVAVSDLDKDGDFDAVFASSAAIHIYMNPTGAMDRYFQGSVAFPGVNPIMLESGYESASPMSVETVDLNGDGYADIVVGMGPGARSHFYINPGPDEPFETYAATIMATKTEFGNPESPVTSVKVVDLNGDGLMDIVVGIDGHRNIGYLGQFSLSTCTTSGGQIECPYSLQTQAIELGSDQDATKAIAVGDLNGDGILDVVSGNYQQTNKVYIGQLSGTTYSVAAGRPITVLGTGIPASTDATRALTIADSDNDGWLDVLAGNEGQQNRVYYGNGAGNFKGIGAIQTSLDDTFALVTGDLNKDGNMDAVVANMGAGAEVTLGVSVPVEFDLSAVAAKRAQFEQLSFSGAGTGGNPEPTMTDLEIIVGPRSTGLTVNDGTPDSQCPNPSDAYIPVTVRFYLDFPLVVCYTPECIILNPLEGMGKAVTKDDGTHLPECPSSGISYSQIHREVLSEASPLPPPPPPVPVSIVKDPHLAFAHGGKADFKGEHMSWYNLLSAKNLSLNVMFVHADFKNPFKLVHGSHMAQLGMVVRSQLSGKLFQIEFAASNQPPYVVNVRDGNGKVLKTVTHGNGGFEAENIAVSVREKRHGVFGSHGATMIVNTGRWQVEAQSKAFPNAEKNPGKALLDVQLNPLYDADHDVVAPHGLIGQSWDGDGVGVDGAQDDYKFNVVTTKAMAEGAIEGVASDYEVEGKFATDFKFSRFDAASAKPRDVSTLTGKRVHGVTTKSAGAKPDIEEIPDNFVSLALPK